eukprot:4421351-Amphidinium_carterae.6
MYESDFFLSVLAWEGYIMVLRAQLVRGRREKFEPACCRQLYVWWRDAPWNVVQGVNLCLCLAFSVGLMLQFREHPEDGNDILPTSETGIPSDRRLKQDIRPLHRTLAEHAAARLEDSRRSHWSDHKRPTRHPSTLHDSIGVRVRALPYVAAKS